MFRARVARGQRRRAAWILAAGLVALSLAAAGCGNSSSGGGGSGGSSSGGASGSTLTIADVAPFTGPDAALGPTYLVSCDAAANAINSTGGVLGHKLACKSVDTRG